MTVIAPRLGLLLGIALASVLALAPRAHAAPAAQTFSVSLAGLSGLGTTFASGTALVTLPPNPISPTDPYRVVTRLSGAALTDGTSVTGAGSFSTTLASGAGSVTYRLFPVDPLIPNDPVRTLTLFYDVQVSGSTVAGVTVSLSPFTEGPI